MVTRPSALIVAWSPVRMKPSGRNVSLVAFSLFRYPIVICGPRASNSPGSLSPSSLPSSSMILISVEAQITPTEWPYL